MIGEYIAAIYKWGVGIIAVLAVVVMMFGGLMLITSGGNQERVQSAKGWIGASATGLVLALTSFTILYLVNPNLTEYGSLGVDDAIPKTLKTNLEMYSIIYTDELPCGVYDPASKNPRCGTQCPPGSVCQKTETGVSGPMECPKTPDGKGNRWICTTMSLDGADCCTNNNDDLCQPGFVCNMAIYTPSCRYGVCALRQGQNLICAEDDDCVSGFSCVGTPPRCQPPVEDIVEGQSCVKRKCPEGMKCVFGWLFAFGGECYDGSPGDPCCYDRDCASDSCQRPGYHICTVGNRHDFHCN